MNKTRRIFLLAVASVSAAFSQAAPAPAEVDDKGAPALALGYVTDARQADTQKFPWYVSGQVCAGCVLYQGGAVDAAGGCPLFADKQVAAQGWCSAWAKKG